jgi:hypothetical protein
LFQVPGLEQGLEEQAAARHQGLLALGLEEQAAARHQGLLQRQEGAFAAMG